MRYSGFDSDWYVGFEGEVNYSNLLIIIIVLLSCRYVQHIQGVQFHPKRSIRSRPNGCFTCRWRKIHFFWRVYFPFLRMGKPDSITYKTGVEKIKKGDPIYMAAYGRRGVCRFLSPQLWDRMSKHYEKNYKGRKPRWLPRDLFSTGCDNYSGKVNLGPCGKKTLWRVL